jgi:hypothetical protein
MRWHCRCGRSPNLGPACTSQFYASLGQVTTATAPARAAAVQPNDSLGKDNSIVLFNGQQPFPAFRVTARRAKDLANQHHHIVNRHGIYIALQNVIENAIFPPGVNSE